MLVERKIRQTTNEVHLGFNEQRQPLLRGDAYHYLIARGDQLAFAAEVVHFGFSPSDFALEIERLPSKHSRHSLAATFSVTVENVQNRRRASYFGGPGRSWIAGFVEDLIAGLSVSRRHMGALRRPRRSTQARFKLPGLIPRHQPPAEIARS